MALVIIRIHGYSAIFFQFFTGFGGPPFPPWQQPGNRPTPPWQTPLPPPPPLPFGILSPPPPPPSGFNSQSNTQLAGILDSKPPPPPP